MITASDELLHRNHPSSVLWTESNWFGFIVPEQSLSTSVHVQFKPNIGMAYCMVSMLSGHARDLTELDDFKMQWYMRMPTGDFDDYVLENGVHVQILEPLTRYRVRYDGGHGCKFDVEYQALSQPLDSHDVRANGGAEFVAMHGNQPDEALPSGHFDQVLLAHGWVERNGQRSDVHHPIIRDRTWSNRSEVSRVAGSYDAGFFDERSGFHFRTECRSPERGVVVGGFLWQDAEVHRIDRGEATYEYVDRLRMSRVVYEVTTDAGQEVTVEGTPTASFQASPYGGQLIYQGLARWTSSFDERTGWGQWATHWDVHDLRVAGRR